MGCWLDWILNLALIYNASPETAQVPLDSAEIEALLLTDGAEFVRDRAKLRHFLSRVRATNSAHLRAIRARQREIEEILEELGAQSDPVEAATVALSKCSAEQQALVYDRAGQALVWQARDAQERTQQAFLAAASDTNRARAALGQALEAEGLPDATRAGLQACLESLPVMRVPREPEPEFVAGGFNVEPGTQADS